MADTAGKVYVFNVFSESMDPLSLNGGDAGAVPGWQKATDKAPYTPAELAVVRKLNKSEGRGHFFNGTNRVDVNWLSGPTTFNLTISGDDFPLTEDLLLFVSRNRWFLCEPNGVVKLEGDVPPSDRAKHHAQH